MDYAVMDRLAIDPIRLLNDLPTDNRRSEAAGV